MQKNKFPHPALWEGLRPTSLILLVSLVSFAPLVSLVSILPAHAAAPVVQDLSDALALVQRGRESYERGQFSEATKLWERAAASFAETEDSQNLAMTLTYLCLAYQQLGEWKLAEEKIQESQKLLQAMPNLEQSQELLEIRAQTLNARGSLELALGRAEAALATWQQAADTYDRIGDEAGKIGSYINQTQALQALGLYGRARKNLDWVQEVLEKQPDSIIKAIGLRSLGNVLGRVGDMEESRQVLEQSLAVFENLGFAQEIAITLLSLGDAYRQSDGEAALDYYRRAAEISTSPNTQIKAELNQLNLLLESEQWSAVRELWPNIQSRLGNLPPSRGSVYGYIDLALSLTKFRKANIADSPSLQEVAEIMEIALSQARSLGDLRAESFALGNLGRLYEENSQWSHALTLTQAALSKAQEINDRDIAYQWFWQLGRIHKELQDRESAIAAYQGAVNALQSIRGDLVAMNPDLQFNFRQQVEPVYRQLVDLLVSENDGENSENSENNLKAARETIDSLQLAELDNFFRDACLDAVPVILEEVDAKAAVIYPIILPDKLAVILSLPNQKKSRLITVSISEREVNDKINQLRGNLSSYSNPKNVKLLSQELYDWLIRPFEADLSQNGVETIAFVLDGSLRNIPMAILYDKEQEQYLVEKYAIAITPSLQLLDPKPLPRRKLRVFAAGLSESAQGLQALESVDQELESIAYWVNTQKILNEQFTKDAIKETINAAPFSVIHLATHGTFSSKAEETFIITSDGKITIDELSQYIRDRDPNNSQPIELLVLSACETAEGDDRSALGLAGFAVRAGARSTIASLWTMDDKAGALLVSNFYRELAQDREISKAEALRRAQLELLKNDYYKKHPYFWASLVLVGNWL